MSAFPSILVPSILPIAAGTHVLTIVNIAYSYLSIMFAVHMRALCNGHDLLV